MPGYLLVISKQSLERQNRDSNGINKGTMCCYCIISRVQVHDWRLHVTLLVCGEGLVTNKPLISLQTQTEVYSDIRALGLVPLKTTTLI